MDKNRFLHIVDDLQTSRYLPASVDNVTMLAFLYGDAATMRRFWPGVRRAIMQTWRVCGLLPTVIIISNITDELVEFEDQYENVHLHASKVPVNNLINSYPLFNISNAFNTPYVFEIHEDGFALKSDLPFFAAQVLDFCGSLSLFKGYYFMNGGFSLRSHRLCRDMNVRGGAGLFYNEDICVNRWLDTYKSKFVYSHELAERFGVEGANMPNKLVGKTSVPFGFHGFEHGLRKISEAFTDDEIVEMLQTSDTVDCAVYVCPSRENFGFLDWFRRSRSRVKLVCMSHIGIRDSELQEVQAGFGYEILESRDCWNHESVQATYRETGDSHFRVPSIVKLLLLERMVEHCARHGIRYALWLDDDVIIRKPVDYLLNRFIASRMPIGFADTLDSNRDGHTANDGIIFIDVKRIEHLFQNTKKLMVVDDNYSHRSVEMAIAKAIEQMRMQYFTLDMNVDYIDRRWPSHIIRHQLADGESSIQTLVCTDERSIINHFRNEGYL